MFKVNGNPIEVTMFPDKTSQVWKLPEELFLLQTINIDWYFDHEGEVMHLVQMVDLFRSRGPRVINLYIDYLPYARQDKPISNQTTFALHSFLKVLNLLQLDLISILDPHNGKAIETKAKRNYIEPTNYIQKALKFTESQIVCYPDFGAASRYMLGATEEVIIRKTRDQLTGQITKTELPSQYVSAVKGKSVLIVDDICDGGRTFVEAAKLLYDAGAREVNLYVTHGIFSKGLTPLTEAGIKRIFTKNGEIFELRDNIIYEAYDQMEITCKE